MTLDARARATASAFLTKYGKGCTLKSKVAGSYDTATGTSTPVVTSYPIQVYLDQPNKTELASGQVVVTDEVAMFAAMGLAVEPKVNDAVMVDGTDRIVKMVNRVWSGELVALWRVGLAS